MPEVPIAPPEASAPHQLRVLAARVYRTPGHARLYLLAGALLSSSSRRR